MSDQKITNEMLYELFKQSEIQRRENKEDMIRRFEQQDKRFEQIIALIQKESEERKKQFE